MPSTAISKEIRAEKVTAGDLFAVKQQPSESLKNYMRRFVHVRCQAKGLSEDTIIDAAIQGIRGGLLAGKLTRKRPQSVEELFNKMEEYARSEMDHIRRKSELAAMRTSKQTPNKDVNMAQPKDIPRQGKKSEVFGHTSEQQVNQIESGLEETSQEVVEEQWFGCGWLSGWRPGGKRPEQTSGRKQEARSRLPIQRQSLSRRYKHGSRYALKRHAGIAGRDLQRSGKRSGYSAG